MKNKKILIIGTIAVIAIGLFAFSKKKANGSVPAELVNKNTSTINREELAKEITKVYLNSPARAKILKAIESQNQIISNSSTATATAQNVTSATALSIEQLNNLQATIGGFYGQTSIKTSEQSKDPEVDYYLNALRIYNQLNDNEVLKAHEIFKKQIKEENLTLEEKILLQNLKTKYPSLSL